MPTVTFLTPDGRTVIHEVEVGQTILAAALANDVEGLLGECGGCLGCGTCHVHVDARFREILPPIAAGEEAMLELASERSADSRLSCQIRMTTDLDGLVLRIAAQQP